jgi:hypothetical protein
MTSLSMIIPVYDPNENFEIYLRELFESIMFQTQYPDQIILGGSSIPRYLERLLKEYKSKLKISLIMNNSDSTSSNLNSLTSESTSVITKILFQDDYFIDLDAITTIKSHFKEPSTVWLAASSKNYNDQTKEFERNIHPKMSSRLANGINSIGSPSVIAFKTEKFLPFNENLKWLLDCEWYLRMAHTHGNPKIIKAFQISNRLHANQATHTAKGLQTIESQMVHSIHPQRDFRYCFWKRSSSAKCSCSGFRYET